MARFEGENADPVWHSKAPNSKIIQIRALEKTVSDPGLLR